MASAPMPPPDKFLGVPTIPLFELDELAPAGAEQARAEEPQKGAKPPVARANCPRCQHLSVGLDADGGHYRWRAHSVFRARGASAPCSASGRPLHDVAPRDGEIVLAKPRDGKPHRRAAMCGCEQKEVA